jgi:hypothetical protein
MFTYSKEVEGSSPETFERLPKAPCGIGKE